jgi:hypothetical protein
MIRKTLPPLDTNAANDYIFNRTSHYHRNNQETLNREI